MPQLPTTSQNLAYLPGHSPEELERLIHQARFFGDLTAHVLEMAGLARGMRVLDVGCGPGDVSFLAAKMVGREGLVIGVDRSPEAIEVAGQRARAARLTNVQFLTQDLSELVLEEPVDALIGRFVLLHLADPAVLLRRLLGFLKPGGLVVFQEMDMEGATSEPYCEVFEIAARRIRQTCARAGIGQRTGLKLGRIFQEAGLLAPRMIQGARVESGPDSLIYTQVEQITRALLPLMERTGVATAAEVGLETLAARIREEALAKNAVLLPPPLIGAWVRKV